MWLTDSNNSLSAKFWVKGSLSFVFPLLFTHFHMLTYKDLITFEASLLKSIVFNSLCTLRLFSDRKLIAFHSYASILRYGGSCSSKETLFGFGVFWWDGFVLQSHGAICLKGLECSRKKHKFLLRAACGCGFSILISGWQQWFFLNCFSRIYLS